jgi:hypothetical protein
MPHDAPSERGFRARPHPLFILFFPVRQYAGIALLTLCAWLGVMVFRWAGLGELVIGGRAVGGGLILLIGAGLVLVRLVWAILQWATRGYGIEDTDAGSGSGASVVYSVVGVLNRTRSEARADALRNVVVDKPFFERVFGLGSVGFATAGTAGYEVVWRIVGNPEAFAARVRVAQAGAGAGTGAGAVDREPRGIDGARDDEP